MASSNFHLRGLSSEVLQLLKKEADKLHMSVNAFLIRMIETGLGIHPTKNLHHDLDSLAGTWSPEEAEEFSRHTQDFEKIDKELWS